MNIELLLARWMRRCTGRRAGEGEGGGGLPPLLAKQRL